MHNYLPKEYYFISKFDKNNINKQKKITAIIYRNYSKKRIDQRLILSLKKYCNERGNKFFLSNNIKLALRLDLDGVYIPSFNRNFKHLSYSLKKKFIIVGSAHNLNEIRIKEFQKSQAIFISSLFKKNKNFLDTNRFRSLSNYTKTKVIALGGISKKNLNKLRLLRLWGFAGISYFE
jgi:thiamine-phosphate pyrophosphorylase